MYPFDDATYSQCFLCRFIIQTDQLISHGDIQNIVDLFNFNSLDDVYTHLGLENDDVENVKEEAEKSVKKQQGKDVLNFWRNKNNEKATRQKMIEAMEKCPNYRKQTEELKQKWRGRLKTFL